MRVMLTGGTGFIGGTLVQSLASDGSDVIKLTRHEREAGHGAVLWKPASPQPVNDPSALEGCDAVVHLAGANVAGHRWTKSYKKLIVESRTGTAAALLRILGQLKQRPKVLVSASATGIYGDRGDELLTEASAPGQGFLPEVCVAWEAAVDPAAQLGVRVVHLRFGVVLAQGGGALKKMLPIFRLGVGGKLGSGRQWMSWVTLPDAVRAIKFAVETESVQGAYNVVSPEPVTNAEFTRTLGHMLDRPTVFAAPAFALRTAFGQMAQDTILASTRALPARLEEAGFRFAHPRLPSALAAVL